jgi:hypothetical protein
VGQFNQGKEIGVKCWHTVVMLFRVCMICLIALGLSGCGAINSFMGPVLADYIPEWAGGLPKGAPPRPGDPRYEQFMQEQKAKAISEKPLETTGSETKENPVH